MSENTIIIIAGPTAVGKTAFAIELAQHYGTEIISADSRQCYHEMKIGVARPSEEELAAVPHHFIASHSVVDSLNAGSFEQYALKTADKIFAKNPIAVMVGGTGLYIKAFCEGIDPMPEISAEIRKEIMDGYSIKGLIWLQKELENRDPIFWSVAEKQNPQRLMRALEVLNATGNSIMKYRIKKKIERPFRIIKIGLKLPKETLHDNIHKRVDMMMEAGLLNEVQALAPFQSYNALQTVGYREIFEYLNGHCSSVEKAVENIKINTRHYAKRQMIWFKKDTGFCWIKPQSENIKSIAVMVSSPQATNTNK